MTERKNKVATTEAVLDLLGIDYRDAGIISVDLHIDADTLPVATIVSYVKGDTTHRKRAVTYREIASVAVKLETWRPEDSPEQNNDTDDWK